MKIKYIFLTIFLICSSIFIINNQNKEFTVTKGKFNIYLEENGDYVKSNSSSYPSEGYYLNTTISECENDSVLSQNNDLSVNISFDKSDKCNLYFDKMKVITFDANGGQEINDTLLVKPGDTYENLPTPVREGYTFLGWNGKNILNYFNLNDAAINKDISVNSQNEITDATPVTDDRDWLYETSNWNINLEEGTYTLTVYFTKKATSSTADNYGYARIYDINSNMLFSAKTYNKDIIKKTLSISENTDIGILIKAYDGVYTIQLEKNSESTEFEPYYVTNETKVTQTTDHILKAIWKENE